VIVSKDKLLRTLEENTDWVNSNAVFLRLTAKSHGISPMAAELAKQSLKV